MRELCVQYINVFSLADAESITAEELRGLSDAVSSLRPKKVLNEELEELKEDREEYRHVSSDQVLRYVRRT